MDNKLTDATILLDRSGSMENIKIAMQDEFKEFIAEQKQVNKKKSGDMQLSLIQFDGYDPQEIVYIAKPIDDINPLTIDPRGMTPLHDALGQAIIATKKRIKNMPKKERPDKIMMIIITDGGENASQEYTAQAVKTLIEKYEKKSWKFVFLGSNQDAVTTASNVGIKSSCAMTYGATKYGVSHMFKSLSEKMSLCRSMTKEEYAGCDFFDDEDRDKQKLEI